MRLFIRFIAIALTVTGLSACETTKPAPLSDAELQQIYNRALGNQTDSSVQTFSLDGAAASPADYSAPQPTGMPSGDESVTSYPLEDVSYGRPPAMPMDSMPYDQGMNAGDVMARIFYGHGQTGLKPADEKIMATIADQCRGAGCGVVRIDGHASERAVAKDDVQRRLINLKTSMDRAANVSRHLIREGIAADAIQVTAHGDRIPPVVAPDTDAEAAARRVEITTGSYSPLMY